MRNHPRRYNILQIIKGLDIGGVNGGAERFGLDLALALDANVFDVSVCIFFRMQSPVAADWESRLQQKGLPYFFASDWAGNDHFLNYIQGIRHINDHVKSRPIDLVHSHFQLGTITALYLLSSRRARRAIRTAHIAREWDNNFYGWGREQVFSKWLFPIFLHAEVGVSQALVDRLLRHPGALLFNHKPALIYNAIPIQEYTNIPLSQKKWIGPVIGVVGRLAEQKGHRYLIEALPKVKTEFPSICVWIVGDGDKRKELEEMVGQLNLRENVKFLGLRHDIPVLLNQMDLFVLPSLWEGLPTVILESLAQGTPVVATDIPGTNEIIQNGQNGWLVPPGNAPALAECIITQLHNPTEMERVRQAAVQSIERFSISHVSQKYANLYEYLLGN